jgi:hypothetical protein
MAATQTFQNPRLSRWQSAVAEAFGCVPQPPGTANAGPDQALALTAATDAATHFAERKPGDPVPVPPDADAQRPETWESPQDEELGIVSYCAQLYLGMLTARGAQKEAIESKLSRFGRCDPRWGEAIRLYLQSEGRPVTYRPPDEAQATVPDTLPEDLTIGLLSDWGTGTPAADEILRQLARFREPGRPFFLIHLGDIYYSGSEAEVSTFVARCRAQFGPDVPVFTLSGNHDMYSGGEPYYQAIATLNLPPFRQETSYFCLRNRYWQLQAMDTGLHDRDPFQGDSGTTYLEPAEIRWHNRMLKGAGGRKVVLLSHHQPFSAFVPVGERQRGWLLCALAHLLEAFARWWYGGAGSRRPRAARRRRPRKVPPALLRVRNMLEKQDLYHNGRLLSAFDGTSPHGDKTDYLASVTAWLWGHEHKTVVYGPYAGLRRGRCIGSGAIPVSVDERPYEPRIASVPWIEQVQLEHDGSLYSHGFGVVRLCGADGTVAYYQYPDPRGRNPLYKEDL